MPRVEQSTIAETILGAPGWARVGITAPTQRIRDSAANELARAIAEQLGLENLDAADPDQLPFVM